MLLKTDGLPSGLGYLELDHRASPEAPFGLPRHFEADTYTCTHCNAVVVMNPDRVRERYKCRGCNHHICDPCAAIKSAGGPCKTMDQRIDQYMGDPLNNPDPLGDIHAARV